MGGRTIGHPSDVAPIRKIGSTCKHTALEIFQLRSERLETFGPPGYDQRVRARTDQRPRHFSSESAGCSGDDRFTSLAAEKERR